MLGQVPGDRGHLARLGLVHREVLRRGSAALGDHLDQLREVDGQGQRAPDPLVGAGMAGRLVEEEVERATRRLELVEAVTGQALVIRSGYVERVELAGQEQ